MNRIRYRWIFYGFVLGCLLTVFDRWLDTHHHSFIFSWSLVVIAFMGFGGLIGRFLYKEIAVVRIREQTIQETHNSLYEVLNSFPGIVIVVEQNLKLRFANRNYSNEFGNSSIILLENTINKQSPLYTLTINSLKNNKQITNETIMLHNRTYEVILQPFQDIDGSMLIIEILKDITLQKKEEAEILRLREEIGHLERLHLLGQLAAGLAHEIRNPMTTVRGYLQLLGSNRDFQTHSFKFKLMIDELDRANLIISEFLSFVRNRQSEMKLLNINNLLHHLHPLLQADAFTLNKQLVFDVKDTPKILFNEKEISQLIFNLCRNGLEAMKEQGVLTIRTYFENEKVALAVQDEGSGISSDDLEKLGTPFFTTKENGTGLGLSTCFAIVDRHNAHIDVDSSVRGTSFYIRFPIPSI